MFLHRRAYDRQELVEPFSIRHDGLLYMCEAPFTPCKYSLTLINWYLMPRATRQVPYARCPIAKINGARQEGVCTGGGGAGPDNFAGSGVQLA